MEVPNETIQSLIKIAIAHIKEHGNIVVEPDKFEEISGDDMIYVLRPHEEFEPNPTDNYVLKVGKVSDLKDDDTDE